MTTTTTTTRSCPDDLLAAARRRPLTDLERQARSAHLQHCDLCRVGQLAAEILRENGRGRAAGTPEEDRALLERVAGRASASVARSARRGRAGARRVAVAALALLGVGSAAFALVGHVPRAPSRAEPAGLPGRDLRPAHRQLWKRPPVAATPAPSEISAPAPAPALAALPRKRLVVVAARDIAPPLVPPATAASLFAEAHGARRSGDLERAVRLYGTLRDRFPESDQARLAGISLGDLLLALDEPARALAAFDAYLAEVRAEPLREEAMFGRARCLRKLGRVRAEEETWVVLLRDFPSSAYAPAARLRLAELRSPG